MERLRVVTIELSAEGEIRKFVTDAGRLLTMYPDFRVTSMIPQICGKKIIARITGFCSEKTLDSIKAIQDPKNLPWLSLDYEVSVFTPDTTFKSSTKEPELTKVCIYLYPDTDISVSFVNNLCSKYDGLFFDVSQNNIIITDDGNYKPYYLIKGYVEKDKLFSLKTDINRPFNFGDDLAYMELFTQVS